jgi:ankyrin repeat protein
MKTSISQKSRRLPKEQLISHILPCTLLYSTRLQAPYLRIEDEFCLVEILFEGGADIDARDKDHETPLHTLLHTAYRNNRLDIAKRLLQPGILGADKYAKNKKGESPSQLAPQT